MAIQPQKGDDREREWREQVVSNIAKLEKSQSEGQKELRDQISKESDNRLTEQRALSERVGGLEKQLSKEVGEIKTDMHAFKTDVATSFGHVDSKIESVKTQIAEVVGTINTNIAKEAATTQVALTGLRGDVSRGAKLIAAITLVAAAIAGLAAYLKH